MLGKIWLRTSALIFANGGFKCRRVLPFIHHTNLFFMLLSVLVLLFGVLVPPLLQSLNSP